MLLHARAKKRYTSLTEAVGHTPLLRLKSLEDGLKGSRVYLKLEYCNPGGSVKDRPALQMIRDAQADRRLGNKGTIIDATSGNTGVAYAWIGAALGYDVVLVMPSNVTEARKRIVKAFGAQIVYSDPMEGSDGAIRMCRQLVDENPGKYVHLDQYSNPSNPKAHYMGTGPELVAQLGNRLTHFVAGVGTSGTAMGTTRRLREELPEVQCIAMQPDNALHGLEGLKHMESSIVPRIFDSSVPHRHVSTSTEAGWDMADRLARHEGVHVGHSAGANVAAAVEIAKDNPGSVVATIACDRGDRYFAPAKWEKYYLW